MWPSAISATSSLRQGSAECCWHCQRDTLQTASGLLIVLVGQFLRAISCILVPCISNLASLCCQVCAGDHTADCRGRSTCDRPAVLRKLHGFPQHFRSHLCVGSTLAPFAFDALANITTKSQALHYTYYFQAALFSNAITSHAFVVSFVQCRVAIIIMERWGTLVKCSLSLQMERMPARMEQRRWWERR